MATIESLDLATLTNNPQSIAEALEDVLETTSGNLGTLKTNAQNDHDHIQSLRTSAQEDHDAIQALTGTTTAEQYYSATLLNSWTNWDHSAPLTDEGGLRIQKFGVLYVAHLLAYKSVGSIGEFNDVILSLGSSDITLPTNNVIMGPNMQSYAHNTTDAVSRMLFMSNGDVRLYYTNNTGGTIHVIANFIGIDVA